MLSSILISRHFLFNIEVKMLITFFSSFSPSTSFHASLPLRGWHRGNRHRLSSLFGLERQQKISVLHRVYIGSAPPHLFAYIFVPCAALPVHLYHASSSPSGAAGIKCVLCVPYSCLPNLRITPSVLFGYICFVK